MIIELGWNPKRLRQNLLLDYLVQCAAAIQFPGTRSRWSGDIEKGTYFFDNGTGDQFHAVWNGDRMVFLAYSHESERSPFIQSKRDGEDAKLKDTLYMYCRFIGDMPKSLQPQFTLAAQEPLLCATAGMWQMGSKFFIGESVEAAVENGLWMLHRHTLTPDAAMIGEGQNWMQLYTLSAEQARVSLQLALRGDEVPTQVNQAELDLIGTVGADLNQYPGIGLDKSRQMYADAGYLWVD